MHISFLLFLHCYAVRLLSPVMPCENASLSRPHSSYHIGDAEGVEGNYFYLIIIIIIKIGD